MARTRRSGLAGAAVASGCAGLIALVGGGCVSQQAYDDLVQENRTLASRTVDLEQRLREAERLGEGLRGATSGATTTIERLQEQNGMLRQQLAQSRDMIADLESRMGDLALSRLDPVTDRALQELAAQYPALIRYDADRGMLRFASDLTFDSGSAVVKDSAKGSLRALAGVLTSPAAGVYDVRIVGHTDSQRVSANTAKRHPTNMHLSAHRAIAVRSELIGMGVPAAKMEASGWGEFRPSVPNTANGNTPANRRVEIFLVPAGSAGSAGAAGGGGVSPAGSVDREGLRGPAYDPTK